MREVIVQEVEQGNATAAIEVVALGDARMQGDPQLALQLYRRVVRRDFHLLALVLPGRLGTTIAPELFGTADPSGQALLSGPLQSGCID